MYACYLSALAQTIPLELRGYQKEVSVKACSGENDIIILPTGTGKTYIAVKIIQDHFTARGNSEEGMYVFTPIEKGFVCTCANSYQCISQIMLIDIISAY